MIPMPKIQQLSPRLSNQIAAGEVVERPASVIKELLENSLDAGSSRIDIDVEQGGTRLMRIRDNGSGIEKDDLPLALARHATSKIHRLEDLEAVATLGFRGEALASVSSVSRLLLVSNTSDQGSGWQVAAEGDQMRTTVTPASHRQGTTVEVRDLFFNTPARRKFLKTEKTEFSRIDDVVRKIALSRFRTGFTLTHNQRTIHSLKPALTQSEMERRVALLCGPAFLENSVFIDREAAGLRLWGWLALPAFSRSQADMQHFYVNDRCIKDKVVMHALRQAYQDVLQHGRHPACLLYLEIEPANVDVNVHPTKHEVRFRDSRLVHDFLFRSLHRALADIVPGDKTVRTHENAAVFAASPDNPFQPRENLSLQLGSHAAASVHQAQMSHYQCLHEPLSEARIEQALAEGLVRAEPANPSVDKEVNHFGEPDDIPPLGYAIAQLKGIYILAENRLGLIVVDMHAAHERITYEQMKQALEGEGIRSQPLLVPESLAVSEREADAAVENRENFLRLGIALERAGPETLLIRQVPVLLR
ncbi:MAG: DNA mismatch repair endonuclease MutL, partial [Pseudomonadales bacterium]|nr:DNA mismatch repair endonuclease MutL [Pseudomonadales bacterium]